MTALQCVLVALGVMAFSSCAENVLIGRNPSDAGRVDDGGVNDGGSVDGGANDGGANDGGANDGGANDGGANDGGANDGGSVDGGANDGGANDGGVNDGGANDGGPTDGGVNDGGSADAGAAGDGGPGDLVLVFNVPLCAEQGESVTLDLRAQNQGGTPVGFVNADVTLPAGTVVQSAPACVSIAADRLSCDAGQVDPGATRVLSLVVQYPAAPGTRYYGARLSSPTMEDAGNNVVDVLTAITGIGVVAVNPTSGPMDAGACFGTVTSYADCTIASLARDTLLFLLDGGVVGDDGTPAIWGASPSGRNLCIRSFGVTGGSVIWGSSINSRCFEGLMDDWETLQSNVGAWQGCY